MPPKKPRSLNYASDPYQITPFESKDAANNWLKENNLDLNGTPILLPFYNQNKRVEFLNPGDDEHRLRIMGEGITKGRNKNALSRTRRNLTEKITRKKFIPHMNKQQESIAIAKNDFLVVYQKDQERTPAGKKLLDLFSSTIAALEKEIILSRTNDEAKINTAKLLQDLSVLGQKLNITAGICYFIEEDQEGNQTVFRHVFKAGTPDEKIRDFFEKEKNAKLNNAKMATPIQIENLKTKKTHYMGFVKEFLSDFFLLGLTAFSTVGAITCCMLIIPFPINLLAAAIASAIIVPGIPLIYNKAMKNNKSTIEFAKTFKVNALAKTVGNFTNTFKENTLGADEVDGDEVDSALSSALRASPKKETFCYLIPSTIQATAMPHKTAPTVLARSFFPKSDFISRLDSIDEDEDDSASPSTSQESSIGIRHG